MRRTKAMPAGSGTQDQVRSGPARARRRTLVRRGTPAGRVLVVGLACFLVWVLLAGPGLKRSAEVSPLGLRRTVSLAVLTPIARVSAFLSLDRAGRSLDRAIGREQPPPLVVGPIDIPSDPGPTDLPTESPPITASPGPSPGPSEAPPPPPPDVVAVEPLRVPTKDDPLTALIIGDSLGEDLSWGLSRTMTDAGLVVPVVHTKISSGLTRPDFYHWPSALAEDMKKHRPQIVVVLMGTNDPQGILSNGQAIPFGTRTWREEYRERVERIMVEVTGSGNRRLVWVGMPIMARADLSAAVKMLNGIYESEAADHPGVTYVDSWEMFTNKKGEYSAYLPNKDGHQEQVRAGDGVHITLDGSFRMAAPIWNLIRTFWKEPTPTPQPSPAATVVPAPGASGVQA